MLNPHTHAYMTFDAQANNPDEYIPNALYMPFMNDIDALGGAPTIFDSSRNPDDLIVEWTNSDGNTKTAMNINEVPEVSLVNIIKRVRFPPPYRLLVSDINRSFKKRLVEIVNSTEEVVIESDQSLEQLLHILKTYERTTVRAQTLTFRRVTFKKDPERGGVYIPKCNKLRFEGCTFEAGAFSPGEWGKFDSLEIKDTQIADQQSEAHPKCKKVSLEGKNEYLVDQFRVGLHFPFLETLKMKDVGDVYMPASTLFVRTLKRLEISGNVRLHFSGSSKFHANGLDSLKTFVFNPTVSTAEGDMFALEIIKKMGSIKKVSVVCKSCRQFSALQARLSSADNEFKVYSEVGREFVWVPNPRKRSARRELKQLVGDEGHRTFITEDPRKAPIRYHLDTTDLDEALFEEQFQAHASSHLKDFYAHGKYPAIFRNVVKYLHNLDEEKKKAIFYYTSGKGSRMLNELLLDRIDPQVLKTYQIRHCNTLLKDVFANVPPVKEPFVVFRGYPSNKLDNGAFHSSTIRADLFTGRGDWYTNFDPDTLSALPLDTEADTTCCHHIIRVMPGARVLYVQGGWSGIARYGEFEVLFAPCMGRFYHIRSYKNMVMNMMCHHWVYVPEEAPLSSEEGGCSGPRKCRFKGRTENARTLESRFNKMNVAVNAPHPAATDAEGMSSFIRDPSVPTARSTYKNKDKVATFVPAQKGLPYESTKLTPAIMKTLMKLSKDAPVPPYGDAVAAAGTIIFEPDGRLWIVHPTNKFVGYTSTFPKGTRDAGEDLRETAIRETYEETGLLVSLKAFPGNCLDDTSGQREITAPNGVFAILNRDSGVTYYYLAKREGGSPADMGWESQAVSLVPVAKLEEQHVGRRYVSSDWVSEPMDHQIVTADDRRSKDSMIVEHINSELQTIQEMLESADDW